MQNVSKDETDMKSLQKAAECGNAAAQTTLATRYYITRDFFEAAKWFKRAAEQGYALAQNNLAYCYEKGEGVSRDLMEAAKWYKKAAAQGDLEAVKKLSFI